LDILTKDGRRDFAYETILVILAPGQTTTTTFLQPAIIQLINNIITNVKTESNTDITIKVIRDPLKCPQGYERKGDECKPKPCPKGQTGTPSNCAPIKPPPDPCIQNPNAKDCPQPPDPCIQNPNAEGCPPDPCDENPDLPQCQADPCDENPDLPQCGDTFAVGDNEDNTVGDNEDNTDDTLPKLADNS
jgi:hypothetical protein